MNVFLPLTPTSTSQLPNRKASAVKRALLSTILAITGSVAFGQTYTDIHDFGYKVNGPTALPQQDGFLPSSGVAFDSAGNMYGTTQTGGTGGGSVLWEMTTAGVYLILHDFGGKVVNVSGKAVPDGTDVMSGVTVDQNGNLYGTARTGGANAHGLVWEYTNGGVYLDRHDFGGTIIAASGNSGPDGTYPVENVTFDSAGNMYGTTEYGGPNGGGMLWELSNAGVYQDLHDFGGTVLSTGGVSGIDGYFPYCKVTIDSTGVLYGTTLYGGPTTPPISQGAGILWKISGGIYQDLHDFGGTIQNFLGQNAPDGLYPSSVALDGSGNIYGATSAGGPNNFSGMVWELSTSGQYSDLHDFGGIVGKANGTLGTDGSTPLCDVSVDSAGDIYGTTSTGQSGGAGDVWEITLAGGYQDLWDFGGSNVANIGGRNGADGYASSSSVSLDKFGNLYGTTVSGGQDKYVSGDGGSGGGIVWAIGSLQSVSLSTSTVAAGVKVTGTVTLTQPAPIGGTVVNLSSSSVNAAPPATIKIPYGSATGTFTIVTGRITSADTATITASQGVDSATAPLSIQPVTLSGFSYYPVMVGGTSQTMNVDLDGPAPAGGLTVQLSVNDSTLHPPSTVFIAPGNTSVAITVSSNPVGSNDPVKLNATLGSTTVTAHITVKP